jgi:thiamine kinase-like enzyme
MAEVSELPEAVKYYSWFGGSTVLAAVLTLLVSRWFTRHDVTRALLGQMTEAQVSDRSRPFHEALQMIDVQAARIDQLFRNLTSCEDQNAKCMADNAELTRRVQSLEWQLERVTRSRSNNE